MATHHEARRVEYIAKDIDTLAANLEAEAKRLRYLSNVLRVDIPDNGTPLDPTERHNIRENVRRAMFGPLRSTGYAVSMETMMYTLDRFVEGEN